MINQKSGKIVNISSVLSKKTIINATEYSISKGALDALNRSLAVEYGKYNININGINIGGMKGKLNKVNEIINFRSIKESDYIYSGIKNDKIPMKRYGNLQEYVNVILFLSSELSSYINGANIPVDGGILSQQ